MTTLADFKLRYPEFVTPLDVGDDRIEFFLEDVLPLLDVNRWGNLFDKGHATLAAHELQLSLDRLANSEAGGGGGPSFPVASKSIGDVSVSFTTPTIGSDEDAYYGATSYGQTYLTLRDMVGIGALAVV